MDRAGLKTWLYPMVPTNKCFTLLASHAGSRGGRAIVQQVIIPMKENFSIKPFGHDPQTSAAVFARPTIH